jgi:hypothetical protein
MYTLEYYQNQFNEAVKTFLEIMKGENEASMILKWAIENNIADTIFCNLSSDMTFLWIQGLEAIYNKLHWCLYDDGRVMFLKTEHSAYIFFDDAYNYSEVLPESIDKPFGMFSLIPTEKVIREIYSPIEFMLLWELDNNHIISRRTNWKYAKEYKIPDR